jgi:tRNA/tmRNA/rRNA uracil-C5-methylase (TrmA/RlmC/RlmD family)
MSGGWKWINIPYEEQLKIKEQQIKESLKKVEQKQANLNFLPIASSPTID